MARVKTASKKRGAGLRSSMKELGKNTILKLEEPAVVYKKSPVTRNLFIASGPNTEDGYIALIRKGIKKHTLFHLMDEADFSNSEMAAILKLAASELSRKKGNETLTQDQSEKALLIAKLYTEGEAFFGSIAVFNQWMNSAVKAFGGKKPKEYLDTISGIQLIMNEIGRIQHGVFS